MRTIPRCSLWLGVTVAVVRMCTVSWAAPPAQWIWLDQPAADQTRYFRRAFTVAGRATKAELRITCDNEFILYLNGQEVGRHGAWPRGQVFDVVDRLVAGRNVIAVQGRNREGPAGLIVWLRWRDAAAGEHTVFTDAGWRASRTASSGWMQPGFDDSHWPAAKTLGRYGSTAPWLAITWAGRPDPNRFNVPDGFTVDLMAAPTLTGSIINMTFDCRGRPVISRERGPVFILEDLDRDGEYDKAKPITDEVTNCQGILAYDERTFYLVGHGPDGAGLYRATDADGDDATDRVELVHKFRGGMGEHGPHAVVAGPDGFLYLCVGNHAGVRATPEETSPVQNPYEADLLPRYEDANGHARGVKVPGGTIWRLDPNGTHYWLEVAGFRNQYDIAFNGLGELFTFDSDMEWDEHLPWYRPVRVNHCVPGAEFGWRSGSNKWPPYYVDSLPAMLDIGRGSPCGVVFYRHWHFPKQYRDALFICDWSYGRIFAVRVKRHGATFRAEAEPFVTGKPLNVTDVAVAPDGTLYFCTGGRGTEGGVYRVRWRDSQPQPYRIPRSAVGEEAAELAIRLPQPQSAWARQMAREMKRRAGQRWGPTLEAAAADHSLSPSLRINALSLLMQFGPPPSQPLARRLAADPDPELRGQAALLLARHGNSATVCGALEALLADSAPIVQRRALEAFLRLGQPAPLPKLLPMLASRDRFVRFTARLVLERINPTLWQQAVLGHPDPRVAVMGLIALNKLGRVADEPAVAGAVFETLSKLLLQQPLPPADELDALRALELTLINTDPTDRPAAAAGRIADHLLDRFPVGDQARDREMARILAALRPAGTIDKLLQAMESAGSQTLQQRADAIHYARCLVAIADGWSPAQLDRFLAWFQLSRDWKGGHSYAGYVANFLRDLVRRLDQQQRLSVLQRADELSRPAEMVLEQIEGANGVGAFLPELRRLLARGDQCPVPRAAVLGALGRTGRSDAEALIKQVYDQRRQDRDAAIVALANFPNTRNWPLFVAALQSKNNGTVRAALHALKQIEHKPNGPEPYRLAVRAGQRLGRQGAWDAVVVLRQWAGKHFGFKRRQWEPALDKWQSWCAEQFGEAGNPDAGNPSSQAATHQWSYDQLLAFLQGRGGSGDIKAGRKVFEQAVCSKCHRFGQLGSGLGPDLTTVAARFKPAEILESIIYPSRVISDQYKSVLVATKDGDVINGMRAPDDGDNIVLLLSDATTLRLPKSQVEQVAASSQSVMPDGLLNEFTLQQIADLFAFLESGRAQPTAASSGGPPR